MPAPSLEGKAYRFLYPLRGESAGFDQERQIHQVFDPAVCGASRERVSMELLSKLLFARNHTNPRTFDAGELEPLPAFDGLQWLHDCVADSGIQMESRKHPPVHCASMGYRAPPYGAASKSITGKPIVYSNQSPREMLAAFCSISRTARLASAWPATATTGCKLRSISTVERAVLKRSSRA